MKKAVIILAAGEGKRMTKTKQLLPWGDTTVLGQSIQCYKELNVDELIVVLGYMADTIRSNICDDDVIWAYNESYKEEMAHSFMRGFEKIDKDTDVLYLALGDTPAISVNTLKQIEMTYLDTGASIIIPVFDEHRGHPVLFSKEIFKDLSEVGRKYNLREVINNNIDKIFYLKVSDESIIKDIDTLEEYISLSKINNLKPPEFE